MAKERQPWVIAVREKQIESRREVTDAAIIDAVLAHSPKSVLDIGCGEGWLSHALAKKDIRVTGIDAIPELIEQARQGEGGSFEVVSYEELAAGRFTASVDVIVCNFSLIGNESTTGVIQTAPSLLTPKGSLIVQTLHPVIACGDLPYRDGWRKGSWAGFDSNFSDPAPWYFRTLETWIRLFEENDLHLVELREPLHPNSQKPASMIFVCNLSTVPLTSSPSGRELGLGERCKSSEDQ